jgi:hypothetical protein
MCTSRHSTSTLAGRAPAPSVIVAILITALGLSGCAAPGLGTGAPAAKPPSGLSRDQLITVAASCHLLRVGQNMDNQVTDATVIATVQRYQLPLDTVIQRAGRLLREASSPQMLALRAQAACAQLSVYTRVQPALVRLQDDGRPSAVWLRVDDAEITDGFAQQVIRELRAKRAVGLIINSPGGSVSEARTLGRYLRTAGLRTAVDRACLSACIDVLAGGAERYATSRAKLGVHQSSVPRSYSSHEGGQLYVAESFHYLDEMGVDPDVAIAAASIPHDQLLVIPLEQALRTRLITAIVVGL